MWVRQWPRRVELRKNPLANSHVGAIHLRAATRPPTRIQIVAAQYSAFRCHRRFGNDAEPRTRWSKAQETAVPIDHPEIAMTEAGDVPAALVLGEAYELAGQRCGDKHLLTAPLDRTIPAHAANLMISVVPGIL